MLEARRQEPKGNLGAKRQAKAGDERHGVFEAKDAARDHLRLRRGHGRGKQDSAKAAANQFQSKRGRKASHHDRHQIGLDDIEESCADEGGRLVVVSRVTGNSRGHTHERHHHEQSLHADLELQGGVNQRHQQTDQDAELLEGVDVRLSGHAGRNRDHDPDSQEREAGGQPRHA